MGLLWAWLLGQCWWLTTHLRMLEAAVRRKSSAKAPRPRPLCPRWARDLGPCQLPQPRGPTARPPLCRGAPSTPGEAQRQKPRPHLPPRTEVQEAHHLPLLQALSPPPEGSPGQPCTPKPRPPPPPEQMPEPYTTLLSAGSQLAGSPWPLSPARPSRAPPGPSRLPCTRHAAWASAPGGPGWVRAQAGVPGRCHISMAPGRCSGNTVAPQTRPHLP